MPEKTLNRSDWGVCAVAIPRESYHWLEDWISHHIKAGATKVVIYDNTGSTGSMSPCSLFSRGTFQREQKSKRGEPYGELTSHISDKEIQNTLKELEEKYCPRFEVAAWQPKNPQTGEIMHGQTQAYADFVRRFRDTIAWGLFIDLDEYLYCSPGITMDKLLTHLEKTQPDVSLLQLRQWQFSRRWGTNGPNNIDELLEHTVESQLGAPKALVRLKDTISTAIHISWGLKHEKKSIQANPEDMAFCHYNLRPHQLEEGKTHLRLQPRAFLDTPEDIRKEIRLLPPLTGQLSPDMEIIDPVIYKKNNRKVSPAISVIMPVRNAEFFLLDSIESILKQTFQDFEFIIIDDASTDNTRFILDRIHDSRIVRIDNNKHGGNYKCRNQGLLVAKGKYIAVMDADDISSPGRLQKQYEFMELNLQYAAVGSDIEFFEDGTSTQIFRRLRDKDEIKVELLKDNVCTHPALFLRKEILDQHGIKYNEEYNYSGDYDLMVQISHLGNITNYPEPLLKYRLSKTQISQSKRQEQFMYADRIRLRQLYYFHLRPSIDEIMIHLSLMNHYPVPESKLLLAEKWCNKLLSKNNKLNVYDQEALYNFLGKRLMIAMKHSQ